MIEFLKQLKEETPDWLRNKQPGVKPNISDFFASRVVYYPGACVDGQPVALFNSTHSAHCFLYVDYFVEKSDLDPFIHHHGFRGYKIAESFDYTEEELVPHGWQPHVHPQCNSFNEDCKKRLYYIMYIFQRRADYGEDHGADKFALLYIKSDGIATYDALFGSRNYPAPFCMLIEDYGFGANYSRFGEGGLLEEVAMKSRVFPQYYLFSEHSRPWPCAKSLGLQPQAGGMHEYDRFLYVNKDPEDWLNRKMPDTFPHRSFHN